MEDGSGALDRRVRGPVLLVLLLLLGVTLGGGAVYLLLGESDESSPVGSG